MESQFSIPSMDYSTIAKWATKIRPIVLQGYQSVYLRDLHDDEDFEHTSFLSLKQSKETTEVVDYSKLSVLADVKMLHVRTAPDEFKPTIAEVIRQIPTELLKSTVAFEMVYQPLSMDDSNLFSKEYDAGYNVSVVRLFKAKDFKRKVACHLPTTFYYSSICRVYPIKHCGIPVNMNEAEFCGLKTLQRSRKIVAKYSGL